MDRESLCKEYEKLSKDKYYYRKFFDNYVDIIGNNTIEYDEDLHEFNDETTKAIKEFNKYIKLLNEKKLNGTEKTIILGEMKKMKDIIEDFCYIGCINCINFDSPERKQKRKEIKKKILEYLLENLE